jgi:AraC-like DNA-binding protein/mannose-6-phosphate isomerase-like protein (cupin superfamily)
MNSKKTHKIEISLPDYGILAQSRQKRHTDSGLAHSHSYPSILFIVSGEGKAEYDNKKFDVESDCVILLAKDKSHKLTDAPRKPMTIFSVYFDPDRAGLNKHITDYLLSANAPVFLPLFYSQNIKRHLRQMLFEQAAKSAGYELSIADNLRLALLQIYRAVLSGKNRNALPKSTERVKSVLDFISENCHEQYSLSDAARLAKVSCRQFTNLCRSLTGRSLIKFINLIRCRRAAELIRQTNMPISAVAFEVGYEDLSTFYRAFKKNYKSSPNKFKQL